MTDRAASAPPKPARAPKARVVVLYNQVGEDEFEKLREVDPASLEFKPEYPIHVATDEEEYGALASGLKRAGYRVKLVNLAGDLDALTALVHRRRADVVFNLVEFFGDDPEGESAVAGFLDLAGMPYTGAPPLALTLCRRKGLAKRLLLANQVPTPRYRSLFRPRVPRRHSLRYPVIVKPGREDASAGVDPEAVVHDFDHFIARVKQSFDEFGPPVLAEEFIEGRELHVAMLGNDPPEVLPILEYDFRKLPADHPDMISYAVKWKPLEESYHQVDTICPAKLTKRVEQRVREVALMTWRVTGCRDYARLDLRLSNDGHPYVLEVNPNPDLTAGVSFMQCAEAAGLSFSKTLDAIVQMALARRRAG